MLLPDDGDGDDDDDNDDDDDDDGDEDGDTPRFIKKTLIENKIANTVSVVHICNCIFERILTKPLGIKSSISQALKTSLSIAITFSSVKGLDNSINFFMHSIRVVSVASIIPHLTIPSSSFCVNDVDNTLANLNSTSSSLSSMTSLILLMAVSPKSSTIILLLLLLLLLLSTVPLITLTSSSTTSSSSIMTLVLLSSSL